MVRFTVIATAIAFMPISAQAYIGPGVGLGAIAVTVAVLLALVLLIFGFLWYPLKRLMRGRKASSDAGDKETDQ